MSKKYSFLVLAMGVFMAGYGFFFAGFNLRGNEFDKLTIDLFFAAVGLVLTAFQISDQVRDMHNHNDAVKGMAEKLAETLADNMDPKAKADVNDLVAVMKVVTPDAPPSTDEQLRQIEVAYAARTGRKVKLSFRRDDDGDILGMDSEFEDAEASPEAAEKAAAVRVPVAADEAPRKLSKSQQRRINDRKGYGPITDEEVRLMKNEKRRAARAAKAAGVTTTTTLAQTPSTLKERIGAETK